MCILSVSGCKQKHSESSNSEHNHVLGQVIEEVEATCTKNGMKEHYECQICGQLFDENKNETTMDDLTIAKLGHLSSETWFENDGYHYHQCERCGAKVDVADHVLHEVSGVPATHEQSGSFTHYECDVCKMIFLDSYGKVRIEHTDISPTGHDKVLTYHPEVPATCEVDGTKEYYSCSCGALFEDEQGTKRIENPIKTPAFGHISNGIWKHDDQKHWKVCHYCNEIIEEHTHQAGDAIYQDLQFVWKKCVICDHKMDIHEREFEGCHHERLMHFNKLQPTINKPGHIEYYYCCDCHESFYDSACLNKIENTEYGVSDKRDGRYVSPLTISFNILNSNLRNYLSAKNEQEIVSALRNKTLENRQARKTITWEDNLKAPYYVEVSDTRSFSSLKSYQTSINAFTFEGSLTPNETYYYRIKDRSNHYVLDDLSFKVDNTYSLRPLDVEGVYNVRDLGGWSAKDGHKVQYGKLYRGSNLSSITEKGKETFLNTLGIKTEIDLRGDSPSHDIVDARLNYLNYPIWMYTTIVPGFSMTYPNGPEVGFESFQIPNIKSIFETLANENNYPVYYHCAVGADRTGTISYLINGLLGVEFDDLTKDFEITSFSPAGDRYRSFVNDDGVFDNSGIYKNSDNNWMAWGMMNTVMKAFYGENDKPLYVAIENYLKNVCEISDTTIQNVRRNLLGEDVDFSF